MRLSECTKVRGNIFTKCRLAAIEEPFGSAQVIRDLVIFLAALVIGVIAVLLIGENVSG